MFLFCEGKFRDAAIDYEIEGNAILQNNLFR